MAPVNETDAERGLRWKTRFGVEVNYGGQDDKYRTVGVENREGCCHDTFGAWTNEPNNVTVDWSADVDVSKCKDYNITADIYDDGGGQCSTSVFEYDEQVCVITVYDCQCDPGQHTAFSPSEFDVKYTPAEHPVIWTDEFNIIYRREVGIKTYSKGAKWVYFDQSNIQGCGILPEYASSKDYTWGVAIPMGAVIKEILGLGIEFSYSENKTKQWGFTSSGLKPGYLRAIGTLFQKVRWAKQTWTVTTYRDGSQWATEDECTEWNAKVDDFDLVVSCGCMSVPCAPVRQ